MQQFNELIGKTCKNVWVEYDLMIFELSDGKKYKFYHAQDCCEQVSIESVVGDVNDLIGSPILMAEEVDSDDCKPLSEREHEDCYQWTFYKFATVKGYVDVRWYGTSNGYYATGVYFAEIK